jgi:hypothetical protein
MGDNLEDIARAAMLLFGEREGDITGVTLDVNGGVWGRWAMGNRVSIRPQWKLFGVRVLGR